MKTSKTYWKDIRQSFSTSKGRVLSIVSLMALGAFALVGLKVTAPNIRTTGEHFFAEHQTADLFLMSDYGLDNSDQAILNQIRDKATVEYGYFIDATLDNTNTSFRIFSAPQSLSTYEVISGKMPYKTGEIAVSNAYSTQYKIGDRMTLKEKESGQTGNVLKEHQFTITAFVNSSELLSPTNLGQSSAGTGNLKGYAVVPEETFSSDVYMMARIRYNNVKTLNPFEKDYQKLVYEDKKEIQGLFDLQPKQKLTSLIEENQAKIDTGYKKLNEAKEQLTTAKDQISDGEGKISDGERQLNDGQNQIAVSERQLDDVQGQLADGQEKLAESEAQLQSAKWQLARGWDQLGAAKMQLDTAASQIRTAESTLSQKKQELDTAKSQLSNAQRQLDLSAQTLAAAKIELDAKEAELVADKTQLDSALSAIQQMQSELAVAKEELEAQKASLVATGIDPSTVEEIAITEAKIAQQEADIADAQTIYATNLANYEAGMEVWRQKTAEHQESTQKYESSRLEMGTKLAAYQSGLSQYETAVSKLQTKKAEYQSGLGVYNANFQTLSEKQSQYETGMSQYQTELGNYQSGVNQYEAGRSQLAEARKQLTTKQEQLEEAKEVLAQKKKEYEKAKADAVPELAQKEAELKEAQERVDRLVLPSYQVYTRREVPGSEGYISYESNATTIDSVGNVFPIVLYFVAALVTFTTMARFVEEERLKAGTFKALGYQNKDIIFKFTLYGLLTSLTGTAIGTLLGHTLLPLIIYNTYSSKIVLKQLELHIYPWQTLVALLLGLLSAVLPAFIVSSRELSEKPAQLLLPKPPTSGSKILLERITPIWKRLSFTQKVTARNIFRYKQRMLMTVFGVCGSVTLLFAGLGVKTSVADLNNRQFTNIIKYDMIVVKNSYLSDEENQALTSELHSKQVDNSMEVHYETVTKVAGAKKDSQNVTVIVPKGDNKEFRQYINLVDHANRSLLDLTDEGVIVSEKFARLTGVQLGDTVTVQNGNEEEITVKISGISEMYMSHFMFMSKAYYKEVFGKSASDNAILVNVKDNTTKTANVLAANFMSLTGVQTVVSNEQMKSYVKTIVDSLGKVMFVLIFASALLAIVILYNLTTINVAERIRELCTIKVLGFHTNEVTMYIYRETIILSLFGILVGFGTGRVLHGYMINIIPPENVMFNPARNWTIYLFPTLLVITILIILGLLVMKSLRRIDMLEALKSVE